MAERTRARRVERGEMRAAVVLLAILGALVAPATASAELRVLVEHLPSAHKTELRAYDRSVCEPENEDIDGDGIENLGDDDMDGDGLLNYEDSDQDGDGLEDTSGADDDYYDPTVPVVACETKVEVRWHGKSVRAFRRGPGPVLANEPAEGRMRWSCRRTGRHNWKVTVTYADGRPPSTAKGTFKVPRCTRWKGRRVGRGRAASVAADQWSDEFVSTSDCEPRGRVRGGRASRWRCAVVHNNSYRVCGHIVGLRFIARRYLGDIERDYRVHIGRKVCEYF